MLKRPKGNRGQRKSPRQVEVAHVCLDKPNLRLHIHALAVEALLAHSQHLCGQVETNNVDASSRGRNQHAARATANLQNRTSGFSASFDKECDVGPVTVQSHVVVKVGDERVLVVTILRRASWSPRSWRYQGAIVCVNKRPVERRPGPCASGRLRPTIEHGLRRTTTGTLHKLNPSRDLGRTRRWHAV